MQKLPRIAQVIGMAYLAWVFIRFAMRDDVFTTGNALLMGATVAALIWGFSRYEGPEEK